MKFIYTGKLPIKDIDLVIAGIFKPTDSIRKGTIFEVPDDNLLLIQRVSVSGCYEEYVEPKKPAFKTKKKSKKDKDKEIKEEK